GFFDRVSLPTNALLSLAVLGVLALVVVRLRRAAPVTVADRHIVVSAAAFAGLIAGVAALLATNAFVGFLSFGRRLFGDSAFVVAGDIGSGARLLTDWPGFLVSAAILGALLVLCGVIRLSPPAR